MPQQVLAVLPWAILNTSETSLGNLTIGKCLPQVHGVARSIDPARHMREQAVELALQTPG